MKEIITDNRAMNKADEAVGVIVGLTVAGLVSSFLIPIAIDELVAVNTTTWSSGANNLWGVIDLAIILSVFLVFIGFVTHRHRRQRD